MAAPDDQTQTLDPTTAPAGGSPADDAALLKLIQDADAQRGAGQAAAAPPPSAAPAAAASPNMLDQALQLSQRLMPQPIQPDTTPAQGGIVGLLGRIGSALAGGSVTDVMSPAQRERAGIRALGDFGTSLMAGSGYYPGKPMFGGLAQGFQGATRSEAGSEQQVAAQLGAQQDYQTKQAALRLKALQDALPLLTLDQQSRQAAAARALAGGGGGPAVPGTASGAGGGNYEGTIADMEGTGKNPRSSSSGVGGFLDSTWQDFASANPDLFKGMSPAQVMAAKSDPGLGAKAITWLAQRNAGVLGNSGAPVTGQSLGIAHYVGAAPAAKIMAAPDNAPVAGFVSPEAVKANPELATMTAGQLKQRYANVPNPGFLKPAGGPAASTAPLPAPVQTAGPGAPTGDATAAAPDTTPWDLPGATSAAPATSTPPTDTTTPPPPVQPVAPSHPDIPVPGGGVISHPGEFADYRAKQFVPPTGEDFSPNLAPEQQQAFATKAQQLQLAQQQVSTLPFAEQPKALIEVKAKQAELAAAQQDAIAAKRQAAAANLTKYNETQQKDIQERYNKQADAYTSAAQGSLTSQQKIAEINATSDAQAAGKALEAINTSTAGAQDVVNQSEMARQLSQTAGTPGFLALWPKVADNLVRAGLLSQDEVKQLGAQRGLDAVSNKLILALKSQAGFSRFTNQDLTFLQNTAPSSFTPEQLRTPMLAAIQTAAQRQVQYGHIVNSLHAGGMPVWQAQQEADKQLGSIIPKTPSLDTIADPSAKLAAQGQWVTQNVPVGSFYLKPNGKLGIRGQQSQAGQ